MSKRTRKIGIVRPWKGSHPEARQAAALTKWGAEVVFTLGTAEAPTWREAVRLVRPGDVVGLEWLQLLPEPRGPKNRHPAMDGRDAIEEVERRGGSIVEIGSKRTTADPKQRRQLIEDMARSVGAGGRSLSSEQARANGEKAGSKRGRRPAVFDDAKKKQARAIWESRRVLTWKDAAALLRPLGYSTARAHKEFGPRGGSQNSKR